jgi:hypothetical protein
LILPRGRDGAQAQGAGNEFYDSHFHLTNYIQEVFDQWAPIWKQLSADASLKIRKGNYERLFDGGRRRVRAWEQANRR